MSRWHTNQVSSAQSPAESWRESERTGQSWCFLLWFLWYEMRATRKVAGITTASAGTTAMGRTSRKRMPKSVCPRAACTANWPIAQNKPSATGTEIAVMYLPRLRGFHQAGSSLQFPSHQRRNRSRRDWGALIRCTESSSGGKCWECSWSAIHTRAWICSAQPARIAGCSGSGNGTVAIESTTDQHRFRCHDSFTPQ